MDSHLVAAFVAALVAAPLTFFGTTANAEPAPPAPSAPVAKAAHLEVSTSDGKGTIYLDDKLVGEGSYKGDVPAGKHDLEVRREGFDTFKKALVLTEGLTVNETVTLVRPNVATSSFERPLEGMYGGFALNSVFQLGGTGSELETRCGALGAASCDTPSPFGGGFFFFVGYTWNPVGFELMGAGHFDTSTQTATFDGNAKNGANPLVASPARTEKFSFYRYGGAAALRVRATVQSRTIRASFAAGLGLAVKSMRMDRKTQSTDPTVPIVDDYAPSSVTYVTPGLSLDLGVHFRLGQSTAFSIGTQLWAENAGSSGTTAPDPQRAVGPIPIATPAYHTATGSQVFLQPYVGMMFGP
jgi:hypothetical protein